MAANQSTHTFHLLRRVADSSDSNPTPFSEVKSEVLTEISRKAAVKEAKQLADTTQQDYILAANKARVAEDTVRKVHQKQADAAMQVSRKKARDGWRKNWYLSNLHTQSQNGCDISEF